MNYVELFEAMGITLSIQEVIPPPKSWVATHELVIDDVPSELKTPDVWARIHAGITAVEPRLIRELEVRKEREFFAAHDVFLGGPFDGKKVPERCWTEGQVVPFSYLPRCWAVYQIIGENTGAKFVGYASSEKNGRRGVLLAAE